MTLEPAREVALARGLIDATGARHRRALLRPLNGWQEWSLAAAPEGIEPGAVHALLASCLERLGGYAEVGIEHAAALSRVERVDMAAFHWTMILKTALLAHTGDTRGAATAYRDFRAAYPDFDVADNLGRWIRSEIYTTRILEGLAIAEHAAAPLALTRF